MGTPTTPDSQLPLPATSTLSQHLQGKNFPTDVAMQPLRVLASLCCVHGDAPNSEEIVVCLDHTRQENDTRFGGYLLHAPLLGVRVKREVYFCIVRTLHCQTPNGARLPVANELSVSRETFICRRRRHGLRSISAVTFGHLPHVPIAMVSSMAAVPLASRS